MKNKICILIVAAMILCAIFTGCGVANATSNLPEALANNHDEYTVLDSLRVVKATQFSLMRNGKLYQMGNIPPDQKLGVKEYPGDWGHLCYKTLRYDLHGCDLLSIHNIATPIIRENDKFYVCKGHEQMGVNVIPLKFIGYSPFFLHFGRDYIVVEYKDLVLNKSDYIDIFVYQLENKQRTKEISLEEIAKSKYGQQLEIVWRNHNNETQSHIVEATCPYYEYSGNLIKLESIGTETIENTEYIIYDPTKLEKGFYALCSGDEPQSIFVVQ